MAQRIAFVFGAILSVVGIWGFIQDPVLGIFDANTLHSAVHLLTGAALLAVAAWYPHSTVFSLKVFGVVYALVAILGFSLGGDMILGLLDNSLADGILHVVLALVFIWGGFFSMERPREEMPAQTV